MDSSPCSATSSSPFRLRVVLPLHALVHPPPRSSPLLSSHPCKDLSFLALPWQPLAEEVEAMLDLGSRCFAAEDEEYEEKLKKESHCSSGDDLAEEVRPYSFLMQLFI